MVYSRLSVSIWWKKEERTEGGKEGREKGRKEEQEVSRSRTLRCSVHHTPWVGEGWEHTYPETEVSWYKLLPRLPNML